jgi:hypothetical protein
VHDMSHSSICFIAYEALYFDSKRIILLTASKIENHLPKPSV